MLAVKGYDIRVWGGKSWTFEAPEDPQASTVLGSVAVFRTVVLPTAKISAQPC